MSKAFLGMTAALGILSLTASGAGTAYAQTPSAQRTAHTKMMQSGKMNNRPASAGKRFVKSAAIGGLFEIKSSQLALQKSKNEQVRQFAQMMVDQHTAMANDLKQVAQSKGISLPGKLDKSHQQIYNHLAKLNGAAFDSAYLTAQHMAHVQAADVFSNGADAAGDPDIKSFAQTNLPKIREHLTMAQNLRNGGTTSVAQGSHMNGNNGTPSQPNKPTTP